MQISGFLKSASVTLSPFLLTTVAQNGFILAPITFKAFTKSAKKDTIDVHRVFLAISVSIHKLTNKCPLYTLPNDNKTLTWYGQKTK
jgi:hypothetical protein